MKNILLLIFDFIIILPITLIRLILIYFFGSKYDIGFLDIMMHADNKYFNQEDIDPTIDTLSEDIRLRINYDSRCNKDIIILNNNKKCNKCEELLKTLETKNFEKKEIKNDYNEIKGESIFTKKVSKPMTLDLETETLNIKNDTDNLITLAEYNDGVETDDNLFEEKRKLLTLLDRINSL